MIIYDISNTLLDEFFARGDRSSLIPTSTACYIGMSTTKPTVNSDGIITNFTEPASVTGYRRARLGLYGNDGTWLMDAAKNGSITNGSNFIFFDEATPGGGGFGELKWFGLFPESSENINSKPILAGELTTAVTVPAGNVLIFRPNNLTVSME